MGLGGKIVKDSRAHRPDNQGDRSPAEGLVLARFDAPTARAYPGASLHFGTECGMIDDDD
jgi:hypothetical protein